MEATGGTFGGNYCAVCSGKIYFRVDEVKRLNIIGCRCGERASPIDAPPWQPTPMTITQNICPSCAAKDAELERLRTIEARLTEEGVAKVLFAQYSSGEWEALTENAQNEYLDSARAVIRYVRG